MAAAERPAVRALPEAAQDLQLLLQHLGADLERREREAVVIVLLLVPAGTHAHVQPTAGHLVHGRGQLRKVARVAKRHRRDERPEPDAARLAGEAGQDGPGVGGGAAGLTGKAVVVIGAQERLEAGRLGAPGERQLVGIGAALLRLDHQRVPHGPVLPESILAPGVPSGRAFDELIVAQ